MDSQYRRTSSRFCCKALFAVFQSSAARPVRMRVSPSSSHGVDTVKAAGSMHLRRNDDSGRLGWQGELGSMATPDDGRRSELSKRVAWSIILSRNRLSVRPVIASFTLLATLLHFTVGCCGHVHADGTRPCEHARVAEVCDAGHDHGHDHDHDHEHTTPSVSSDDALVDGIVALSDASPDSPEHDCHGCDCVATSDSRSLDTIPVNFFLAEWTLPAPELTPAVSNGGWMPADPPVSTAIEPRLFERLLI